MLKALVQCMLCAENLTILPIGCIIGQNLFAKVLCSTAAHGWHRVWGPKRNVLQFLPQFYRNLPQCYRNFQAWGTTMPPPPLPALNSAPPTHPPTAVQQRVWRRQERKLCLADKLEQQLLDLESNGYVLVFTDGSANHADGVGLVAGYGVYFSGTTALSAFLPISSKQSNNVAELHAAVRDSKFAIFSKWHSAQTPTMSTVGPQVWPRGGVSVAGKVHLAQCPPPTSENNCSRN